MAEHVPGERESLGTHGHRGMRKTITISGTLADATPAVGGKRLLEAASGDGGLPDGEEVAAVGFPAGFRRCLRRLRGGGGSGEIGCSRIGEEIAGGRDAVLCRRLRERCVSAEFGRVRRDDQ